LANRVLGGDRSESHFGVRANHHKQVIEIMDDASGEGAYRVYFSRTVDLCLDVVLLRHHPSRPGEARHLRSRISNHGDDEVQFDNAALFAA
jgi:hypothetical protein